MKPVALALLLAIPTAASAAPGICTERGSFATLVAVARSKGLDERSVTEAAATDPGASFVERLSHIEIIQNIYRRSKKPPAPTEARVSTQHACELALSRKR